MKAYDDILQVQESRQFRQALDRALDIFGPKLKELIYFVLEESGFALANRSSVKHLEKALILIIGPVGASIAVGRFKSELAR